MRDSCPWRPFARFSFPRIFAVVAIAAVLASASTGRTTTAFAQRQVAYTPDSIFMALFENGDALVEYDIMITNPTTTNNLIVKLIGNNTSDIIVTDLNDKVIPFKTVAPGEIEISPKGATGARMSYLTPDLVNKVKGTWTFSLTSEVDVAIKMPADSMVIDYGNNTPSLLTISTQTLFTFKAGDIHFSYVVGALGTEDQANIAIKAADAAIALAKSGNSGINFDYEKSLLSNAVAAKNDKRFTDAVKIATQVSDNIPTKISDFKKAQKDIADANQKILQARETGRDIVLANATFSQANNKFSQGLYANASSLAAQAVNSIRDPSPKDTPSQQQFPVVPVMVGTIGAVGGGAGIAAYFLLLKKKNKKNLTIQSKSSRSNDSNGGQDIEPSNPTSMRQHQQPTLDDPLGKEPSPLKQQQHQQDVIPAEGEGSIIRNKNDGDDGFHRMPLPTTTTTPTPSSSPIPFTTSSVNAAASKLPTIGSSNVPAKIPDSQTETNALGRIVAQIIEEKPHLRPEDREVLGFLAEKEGAVFESEVRSRFSMPKTTVWRLVKRLEREELVEIRKAGGQNLIKLRFEGRQLY